MIEDSRWASGAYSQFPALQPITQPTERSMIWTLTHFKPQQPKSYTRALKELKVVMALISLTWVLPTPCPWATSAPGSVYQSLLELPFRISVVSPILFLVLPPFSPDWVPWLDARPLLCHIWGCRETSPTARSARCVQGLHDCVLTQTDLGSNLPA